MHNNIHSMQELSENNPDQVKKLYYTFNELKNDLHIIVNKIKESNWNPDIIIGPCRGAYIPGVMLSHHYNIPFHGFLWQTRDGNIKDYNQLINIINTNQNKNILIIDDINDSGITLKGIKETISSNNVEIKFCVLFNKKQSQFKNIDYFAKELTLENNPWVVFPYEEW